MEPSIGLELPTEEARIRSARGRFAAMASAYFLGVFNDNFYKQAALILAVAAGRPELQGRALLVFTLPFLLLAAPAGWAADRFPKRRVVIGAKAVEVLAMGVGAVGVCTGHWWLIFAMLFLIGSQATFFSPALAGSIPELYPASYVTRANGVLRMVVTLAILIGVAAAGAALDLPGTGPWDIAMGRWAVAGTVLAVAGLGLVVSLFVVSGPAASPRAPFPWTGPLTTFKDLAACRHDPLLALSVAADTFIWFSGSLQLLLLNPLGVQQYELTLTATSGLIVAQMLGIGVGGLLSARLATGERWYRILAPSGLLMSVAMLAIAGVPGLPREMQVPLLFVLTAFVGVFGGLFLIPVESFLQVRPAPERKGAVLAAANFAIFGGILLSGPLSNVLNARWLPTQSFAVVGVASLVASLVLLLAFRLRRWS